MIGNIKETFITLFGNEGSEAKNDLPGMRTNLIKALGDGTLMDKLLLMILEYTSLVTKEPGIIDTYREVRKNADVNAIEYWCFGPTIPQNPGEIRNWFGFFFGDIHETKIHADLFDQSKPDSSANLRHNLFREIQRDQQPVKILEIALAYIHAKTGDSELMGIYQASQSLKGASLDERN